MKAPIHWLIGGMTVLAAAAAVPASAAPQYYGSGGATIRCESNDGRMRECATGGARVALERQISSSACIEGRSWGYARDGIWVSQGCRADFRLVGGGYPGGTTYGGYNGDAYNGGDADGYGTGQTIRCESEDGRNRICAMNTRGGVYLVRQISKAGCIQGRSWGAIRGGVWVTGGCRADFRSADAGYGNGGYANSGYYRNRYGMGGQVFRCESNDGRTRECAANLRYGVQLVRVLSNAPCVQGRSWGYARNGIWVAQGCRAEFRSY